MGREQSGEILDYWRAVAKQGVAALGFSLSMVFGVQQVSADIAQPVKNLAQRAALAAIEIHTRIVTDPEGRESEVLAALEAAIAKSSASAQVAAYQAVLEERLWREIEADPPRLLEVLAQARD